MNNEYILRNFKKVTPELYSEYKDAVIGKAFHETNKFLRWEWISHKRLTEILSSGWDPNLSYIVMDFLPHSEEDIFATSYRMDPAWYVLVRYPINLVFEFPPDQKERAEKLYHELIIHLLERKWEWLTNVLEKIGYHKLSQMAKQIDDITRKFYGEKNHTYYWIKFSGKYSWTGHYGSQMMDKNLQEIYEVAFNPLYGPPCPNKQEFFRVMNSFRGLFSAAEDLVGKKELSKEQDQDLYDPTRYYSLMYEAKSDPSVYFCEECPIPSLCEEVEGEDSLYSQFMQELSKINREASPDHIQHIKKPEVTIQSPEEVLQSLSDSNEEVRIEAMAVMDKWPNEKIDDPKFKTLLLKCLTFDSNNVRDWALYLYSRILYDSVLTCIELPVNEQTFELAITLLSDKENGAKILLELWLKKNLLSFEERMYLIEYLVKNYWKRYYKVLKIIESWPNERRERDELIDKLLQIITQYEDNNFDHNDDDDYPDLVSDQIWGLIGKWTDTYWLKPTTKEKVLSLMQSSRKSERMIISLMYNMWPKEYWDCQQINEALITLFYDKDDEVSKSFYEFSFDYPDRFWTNSIVRKTIYSHLVAEDSKLGKISLKLCLHHINDIICMEDTLKTLDLLLVNNQLLIHRSIFSLIFIHKFDYLSVPSIRKNVIDLIKTEIVTINDDIAQIRRIYGYLKVFFKRIPEIREFLIQVIDFQLKSGTEVFTDIFLHLLFTFNNINYFYKEFPVLRQGLSNLIVNKISTNDQFFPKETFKSIKRWPLLDEDTYLRDKYFLQRILEYWSLANLIKYAPEIIPVLNDKLIDYISKQLDLRNFWILSSLTKHWPLDLLFLKLPQIQPFLIERLNEDLFKQKEVRHTYFKNILKDERVNNSFIREFVLQNNPDVQIKILEVFKSQKISSFTRNKELTKIVTSLTGSTHPKIQKLTKEILTDVNQAPVINKK